MKDCRNLGGEKMCVKGSGAIAVFDFDGTLVSCDSFTRFARFAVGPRRFYSALLGCAVSILRWKAGLIEGGVAKERVFGHLYAGMSYEDFASKGMEFSRKLKGLERREIVELMLRHKAAGNEVYIVSASMAEWIVGWAEAHGIEQSHVLGTVPEVEGHGILTGRFGSLNCRGAEKVRRLESCIGRREDVTVYAYGDSDGDTELLAFADVSRRV